MNWQQLFTGQILERGLDYYHRELVQDISIQEDMIEASVYGTEIYDVEIELTDEGVSWMSCDCPHALDGNNCKHMAAVLYYVDSLEPVKKEHTDKGQESKSLVNLVKEADESIVQDFLINILANDEKLLNRFKAALNYTFSPEDLQRYKNQINGIFDRHEGVHGFIDYYSAGSLASEVEELLSHDIRRMMENEQYEEAFELTNDIFIEIGSIDIDDSSGEVGMISQLCMEIWQEILEHSDAQLKKKCSGGL
ncbi:SWIM zinc finger family protein [Oceanobacillus neutriphilus]|uniref:SWIM-type domain-containing protein n=1 Tax=Oceanobacillus neutriphilus TaxID=531815 RepID=A0ABQ2P388_9BACI|nr:SWIM zinc finger family protein [Oceanobacillus neutriphilus]GGP17105.1 hypothetical protein GCM10011346_51750 [Oceanobacillus neutriphilus]